MIFEAAPEIGWALPPVSRQMSLRQFTERHPMLYGESVWPDKNIHSDADAARSEGLDAPVAAAPTIFALITRAMMTVFGEGWVIGGRISVKMIKPVLPDNFVTGKGTLQAKETGADGRTRFVFDVWVENEKREKVAVGTASALGPAPAGNG